MIGHVKSVVNTQPTLFTLPLQGSPKNLGASNLDFVTNGTVNYLNEGDNPTGRYSAGTFTDLNYIKSQSAANSAIFNNYSAYSVEVVFKANSLDGGPIIFSHRTGASASVYTALRILANGAIRPIIDNSAFGDSSAGIVTTGQWYVYGYTYDGSVARAYATPYGVRKSTPDISVNVVSTVNTVETYVGRSYETNPIFILPLNGIVAKVRVFKGVKSYFPQGA